MINFEYYIIYYIDTVGVMQHDLFEYFDKPRVPRNELQKVWDDTVDAFSRRGGRFKKYIPHQSEIVKSVTNNCIPLYDSDTIISVENMCTLDMASLLVRGGYTPLVLNMASNYRPGGGVRKGSRAQEEDLFRKSNYFMTLDLKQLPDDIYPIKGLTMIYSPHVTVIKDRNYADLDEPYQVDFIACPAIRNPEIIQNSVTKDDDYAIEADQYLMEQRIERLYKVAYTYGHDSIILGAFGCGAFHNPTVKVAEMFKKMNERYNRCFKFIGFPVLSDEKNPNYNIFKEILL
jgi:uncharacterized protein (TIGR02452 family)